MGALLKPKRQPIWTPPKPYVRRSAEIIPFPADRRVIRPRSVFPSVQSTAQNNINGSSVNLDFTIPSSPGVNDGDLLIYHFNTHDTGTPNPTEPTGWIELQNNKYGPSGLGWGQVVAKKADGTEGGTTITVHNSSEPMAVIFYQIRSWGGTLTDPFNANDDIDLDVAEGQSSSPNAPSVTAGWGGTEDNLWIFFAGSVDDGQTMTAAPTGYTDIINEIAGTANNDQCACHSARRELAANTHDPDSATIDGSEEWQAFNVCIRPGTSGEAAGGSPWWYYNRLREAA